MKKEKQIIGFKYNTMFPSLQEQANEQGRSFDYDTNIILERMRNDIFSLKFIDNVTDKDHENLFKSFHKIVVECLK